MSRRNALRCALLVLLAPLGCAPEGGIAPLAEDRIHRPAQNWTAAQSHWFHHTSQGTRVMPYSWFLALEQPGIGGEAPPFAAPDHMARFGFLPSPPSAMNPDGLPIGFARDVLAGQDGAARQETIVGLTCAACHTGQIEHGGRAIRLEGGPAMIDIAAFQASLGRALLLTRLSRPPFFGRFDRFATRVLTAERQEDTPAAREALRRRMAVAVGDGLDEQRQARRGGAYPVEEGFGRLDALGRGGNFVFATLPNRPANLAVANGPVSYPALWDAPWFDWVQYNASIRQPMARNVAEAMGVRAVVRMPGAQEQTLRSSVRVQNIFDMERQLAGARPGDGLRSPLWPEEILGPIDRAAAERGRPLFEQHCAGCHQPLQAGQAPRITLVPLERIGTDPRAALNFAQRRATLADGRVVSAAEGLRELTDGVIEAFFVANNVPQNGSWTDAAGNIRPGRSEMVGNRPNEWAANRGYRARPLNGIWATAPYLHNGSVPNLYQMLSPASQRDRVFYLGSRQYDPRDVGFRRENTGADFAFDTRLPGNANTGHEFRDGPRGGGVIGPALSERERRDLIEYLKTL